MVDASVVIFDYDRKEFIKDTIKSIVSNIGNHNIEILVIKSYEDGEIDEFLKNNNVKFVTLLDNKSQSDYIKCAVKESLGEILMFHDDDDQFANDKIGYVCNLFNQHEDLGYYHNNFNTIDQEGNAVYNRNYKTPEFASLYIKNSEKTLYFNKKIKLINYIRPDFNATSICIRKSIITDFHKNFEFNVRPDTFLLIMALLSDLSLFFDNKVLTHYRLYGDNVSTSYNAPVTKMRKTFMKAFLEGTKIFSYYLNFLEDTPYSYYLQLRIINLKLAYNFWALKRKYKITHSELKIIFQADLLHESEYYIISILPARLKLLVMRLAYNAIKD
ncbi:glycosyltransferase family 2 [Ferroplasma acidiphilum]|uniref:Glycosyltransferase family 2 n=1 Tax=Ferroplasma acidiphilum TaxID=74969 RepID=A0A1V0N3W7_9ARCH|nr:glycosyltransferase family A protein [Ferroplasma acidiphilum]ARD84801.1 glycosyltransferase family 2 [Ferroplasma acidiphilum]